jgi:hypothetical protein
LADFEAALFGTDPYRLLDNYLGWVALPVDRIYGFWLPVQLLVLFSVIVSAPSPAKSRALTAYALAWLVLGIVAAALMSSAGPIFFDRTFGGARFAPLRDLLETREAWMALSTSDTMWQAHIDGHPGLVAGISAAPSMHVAISLWIVFVARDHAPRGMAIAIAYLAFIWLASVQLGWHYAADGLIGMAGMAGVWALSGRISFQSSSSS